MQNMFQSQKASNYYKEKIGMTYKNSIRLEQGEVYAFTDSRSRAQEYIESLITQYGQPLFNETQQAL